MNNYKKTILVFYFGFYLGLSLFAQNRIPIEYDRNKKGIVMDAIINDTLHMKVFFDTGTYGFLVADSLNLYDGTETARKVKIGTSQKIYYDYPKGLLDQMSHKNPVFEWFDIGAIIGWDFFDDKIIHISFKDNYMREIEETEIPSDYESFAMEKENNKWGIFGIISILGKQIKENVMIDTGHSGAMTFNSYILDKYDISLKNSAQGKTTTVRGLENRSILQADTISIGNNNAYNQQIAFRGIERRSPFAALLGNVFFQDYSLVLDFKSNTLYLKREEVY